MKKLWIGVAVAVLVILGGVVFTQLPTVPTDVLTPPAIETVVVPTPTVVPTVVAVVPAIPETLVVDEPQTVEGSDGEPVTVPGK